MGIPIPNADRIVELVKKGMTIEAQEQIMALREAAIELKVENTELKEELAELKRKTDIQARLVWEQPYYWLKDGDKTDGLYCQLCWDKEQRLIRLQGGGNGEWFCHCCTNTVTDKNYVPPKRRESRLRIVEY